MTEITIQFPEEFVNELDRFIDASSLSYENREEFLREAVRVHLRKMKD